jgi:hypothetical protein
LKYNRNPLTRGADFENEVKAQPIAVGLCKTKRADVHTLRFAK